MGSGHRRRIALIKEELARRRLDSFLVTDGTNVSYLSGFAGHDSTLIITRGADHFITDSRYIEEARRDIRGFDIRLAGASTFDTISAIAKKRRLKRLGFESMDLPYGVVKRLRRILPSGCAAVDVRGAVEDLRAVKDAGEVALIRNSIRLTHKVFDRLVTLVRPGVSERKLAAQAQMMFLEAGAAAAFDPIVATGPHAALPHARPDDTPIREDGFVMFDVGCRLRGYCSDMTRMVMLGAVKEKFKKMYFTVRAAQEAAIGAIAPGVWACDVDRAGRSIIERRGFGKYFGHSLGHGVGMQVHEGPAIAPASRTRLVPGMVFTVEPAIYVPKFGGVRIEDMVLVTKTGCEILTR